MRFAVVAVNTPDRTDMACFLTVGVDVSGIGFFAAGVAYVLQSTEFGKRFVQPVVPRFHRSLVPPEVADFVGGVLEYIFIECSGTEQFYKGVGRISRHCGNIEVPSLHRHPGSLYR